MSKKLFSRANSNNFSVSGVDDVVGEKSGKKEPKTSLISSTKKEKKKSKEKETRYAHLGDESSGEDEADGKYVVNNKLQCFFCNIDFRF